MTNKAAITKLADFIESAKWKFDMADLFANTSCGSAGCIGGHAVVLWPEIATSEEDERITDDKNYITWDDELLAAKLKIGFGELGSLCFLDDFIHIPMSKVTREDAVRCLRNLAETGKVDWHWKRD